MGRSAGRPVPHLPRIGGVLCGFGSFRCGGALGDAAAGAAAEAGCSAAARQGAKTGAAVSAATKAISTANRKIQEGKRGRHAHAEENISTGTPGSERQRQDGADGQVGQIGG